MRFLFGSRVARLFGRTGIVEVGERGLTVAGRKRVSSIPFSEIRTIQHGASDAACVVVHSKGRLTVPHVGSKEDNARLRDLLAERAGLLWTEPGNGRIPPLAVRPTEVAARNRAFRTWSR